MMAASLCTRRTLLWSRAVGNRGIGIGGSREFSAVAEDLNHTGLSSGHGDPSEGMKMRFYAVVNGWNDFFGVARSWCQCKKQVSGRTHTRFKYFPTMEDAVAFLRTYEVNATISFDVIDVDGSVSHHVHIESQTRPRSAPNNNSTASLGQNAYVQGNVGQISTPVPVKEDDSIVNVYTDGACADNGYRAASGGIGVYFGSNDPRNISERLAGPTTNNRAEITAVLRALEVLEDDATKHGDTRIAVIRTDSSYVCDGLTKWIKSWKRRDWKVATGSAVKNKDLWEALDKAYHRCMELRPISLQWIKGHNGHPGNEAADALAMEGAFKLRSEEQTGETNAVQGASKLQSEEKTGNTIAVQGASK